MIKPYEFWHPRIFEAPFYAYLGIQCLANAVSVRSLAKANYCLDHGDIGIGSKYDSQLAFDQRYFLPTRLIQDSLSHDEKESLILEFIEEHGLPVLLKSDVGCVGKGICKISSPRDLKAKVPLLLGSYILQKFTDFPLEWGIFYIRHNNRPRITGINKKHFPSVTGNGRDNLITLAKNHERFSHHWNLFLQYIDSTRIPEAGEEVGLSFIGSHTMGCKFTDETHTLTPELERAVFKIFEDQPGFNFGRIDVKAESEAALYAGEFVVIEVNGVASLPTHMFDPKYNVLQAWRIFFEHGKYLVKIAREHRNKQMNLLPYREIIARVRTNQSMLDEVHGRLKSEKAG